MYPLTVAHFSQPYHHKVATVKEGWYRGTAGIFGLWVGLETKVCSWGAQIPPGGALTSAYMSYSAQSNRLGSTYCEVE